MLNKDKDITTKYFESYLFTQILGMSLVVTMGNVSLRSVSGQSQVSKRSVSGLSELTLSVRQSLKYLVLFISGEYL